MILQISADFGRVGNDGNAVPAQEIGRADTGELQDLRRLQRAAGQDDFAISRGAIDLPFADPLDAGGCAAGEGDPADLRMRDDGEVRPVRDRMKEGGGGARAPMFPDAELIGSDAQRGRVKPSGRAKFQVVALLVREERARVKTDTTVSVAEPSRTTAVS